MTLPANAWMAPLSAAYPSVRFDVLDRLEISPRRVLFDVRLPTLANVGWTDVLRDLPEVRTVELLDANPSSEVYRVLFAGRTFVPLVKRLRLLRRFPFPVEDGKATWFVVGAEVRVRRLLAALRRAGVAFTVDAVRRGSDVTAPRQLTSRQREVLRRAVREGYFEVPRRVSLTELAARLGVASSTLSVTLALIERKIVAPLVDREELAGPLPKPPRRGRLSARRRVRSSVED